MQSIAELAEQWSDLLIAAERDADKPPVAPVVETGSVLRPGASKADIAAAETRLGVQFPDDYCSFLRHSNGAYASWGSVLCEWELFAYRGMPEPGIGLLPVEHVAPVKDVEEWWTELWVEGDQGVEPKSPPPWSEVMDFRPLADGLLISSMMDTFKLVLVPVAGRWEVWDHYKEGATRHESFEAWLRFRIASMQPAAATSDEFRSLLDHAASGDERARLDILKVSDTSLESVVVEALADDVQLGFVLPIVDRWPSDAVVDALDHAIATHSASDPLAAFSFKHLVFTRLMVIATERAEAVLRKHGAALQADAAHSKRTGS